jgi:hypothetical protein
MPSSKNYKRDYKKEYSNYQGKADQKKKRASRGRARYKMMKKGKVRLGDGLDVIHKSGNPLQNDSKNLGVQSKSENRSYARTRSAKKVNKSD